jgi:hypothetical protein
MNKKTGGKSGFFNPRIVTAFILVTIGISIGVFSFAAPQKSSKTAQDSQAVQPTVINSTFNGVSKAMRDLPKVNPLSAPAEAEHDLLRVKPTQPVPAGFVDQAVQSAAPAVATIPAPNGTFEGQSSVDSAGGSAAGCICTPPDPNGAIGPTQYVQMVNSVVSVYNRAGTRLSGPTQINSIFSTLPATSLCSADNNGDPIVVYDQLADRWLISQFAVTAVSGDNPPSSECIAISKSGDATGEWYIYDFQLTGGNFEDYPHIGLWPDAYYMSTHEFSFASGNPFLGAGAWAFERAAMLAGQPARVVYFRLGAGDPVASQTFFGGQEPSTLDGFTLPPAGSPNYFVEVDAKGDGAPPDTGVAASTLAIWKFHVDWSNPANSTFGDSLNNPNTRTPVTDFARPGCTVNASGNCVSESVPQAGDPGQLDAIGDRLMYRNAYRNFGDHESLVLNHTVVAQAVGGHAVQMGPRWYEVRNPGGTPTIFQQSTLGPLSMTDLLYRWMSSIAMDRAGNMAIGYSTSSSANFPSIAYSGRLATDPVSTMAQGEAQMFAGTGPQHNELFIPFAPTRFGRWGDYTDMTVDPADDCTFWYTNMYYSSTDAPAGIWHTRIGSFKFPQCTPRQTGILTGVVTDSGTGNPIAGASVTAGGYTAITFKNGVYQFSPLSPGSYNVAASEQGYFPSTATGVPVTNGGNTVQNFALTRNPAQPTPTPAPTPLPLETVNPPALTGPSGTTTNSSYMVTWSPAEVTTNLANYIVEESTDYVNPLFDNADGLVTPPATVGPLWSTSPTLPWTQSSAFFHSMPFSYFANAPAAESISFATGNADTSLTLNNNITIPTTVGSGRLTFWSRYFNDPDDTGNVEISTDGGSTWNKLKVINIPTPVTGPPADTRMQSYEVNLSPYRGSPFKLQFRYNSGGFLYFLIRTVGWWVDDINVDGATWKQVGTTDGITTSLNITNKPGGHYFYRVRGAYTDGTYTDNSNVKDIVVNLPLSLTSVVSEKAHGTAGNFDVNLPLPPNSSPRGVECRTPGSLPNGATGDYQLIFTFSNNLQSVGSATVAHAQNTTASVASTAIGPKPNQYTVNLSNVSNQQYIQVNLFNVTDSLGNTVSAVSSPEMGVLVGDVTANGSVDSGDVTLVRQQTLQNVTQSNFREDVNANGSIDSGDVTITRQQTLTSLPTPP